MQHSLDQSPIFYLNALCLMTPDEVRILEAIQWWVRKVDYGKIKSAFPSRLTLAKRAKTSVKTVDRFSKKYANILFEYISGKNKGQSNVYKLFDSCFDVVEFLRHRGYIFNFKKHKKWIQKTFELDQDFYDRRDAVLSMLSTMKCRTLRPPKCPTTKTSSPKKQHQEEDKRVRTWGSVPIYEQTPKKESFERGYKFLKEVGVEEKEAIRVCGWFPSQAWFEAKNDFWWYIKQQPIENPIGFMIQRAKEYTKKLYRV